MSRGNGYRVKNLKTSKSNNGGDKVGKIQDLLTEIVVKNSKKRGL